MAVAVPPARAASEPPKPADCGDLRKSVAPTQNVEVDTRPASALLRCQGDEALHEGDEQLRQYLEVDEDNLHLLEAQTAYGRACDLYHEAGERLGQAKALLGLARVHDYLGSQQEASDQLAALRALYRQPPAEGADAAIIFALAEMGQALDQSADARADYKQAIALYRQGGDRAGEAAAWAGLGVVDQAHDRAQAAHDDFASARALLKDAGGKAASRPFVQFTDPSNRGYALLGVADVAQQDGDSAEAKAAYAKARIVFQQVTNRRGEGFALLGLADLAAAQGDAEHARTYYEEARGWFQRVGESEGEARLLVSRAAFERRLGDTERARDDYREAQGIFGTESADRAKVLLELGALDHEADEQEFAAQSFDQARQLFHQLGDALGEAQALSGLAEVERATGDRDLAQRDFEAAAQLYDGAGQADRAAGARQQADDLAE